MIEKLYGKYFQKSRSFLYPVLGIKKSLFSPIGTYLSIEGRINPEELKLICTFKDDHTKEFETFENQMLIENPLFSEKITTSDFNIYVFDMGSYYESDYFNVILGKYSKLSAVLKRAIKTFYGEKSAEYKYIETYLYPDKFFDNYATLLQIDVETLKSIGELCDPCDLSKETLKISAEELPLLNKI